MSTVRHAAFVATIGVLATSPVRAAVDAQGHVCVAPYRVQAEFSSPEIANCKSENIWLKIDNRPPVRWSHDRSEMLNPRDTSRRHTVAVLCDRKPQQAFFFRFDDVRSDELCLFVNDLYHTVQLWKRSEAPWCACK